MSYRSSRTPKSCFVDSAELKEYFSKRVSLSSADLVAMAQLFAQLYGEFQTDIVHRVCCTDAIDRPYIWVDPLEGRSSHVILFFHGGGYTMGSSKDHMQLIASLVELSGKTFLAVDYRLFPAVTFPAPLDDAEASYRWLLEQGLPASRIGLAGISAGAALVTQLVHRCAKKSLGCPALAMVMSGLNDFRFDRPSMAFNSCLDLVSLNRLESIVEFYFPDQSSFESDDVLCINQNYNHYPKTLFQVGDQEILLSDAIEMHQSLRSQGHDVHLNVVPQMIHCGQMFARDYPPGQSAIEQAAGFIKSALQ
ncbi:alpha/beta hydrolase fold family protein [Synechococcus sp. BIOS-E4-1]|nr:alpha/beta hydrolase fold family protein [Synechococcus sp. BIOS-E4-1]